MAQSQAFDVEWLGRVPYGEALELQQKRVEARLSGAGGDVLLLLEHPPVVTLGRSAKPENLRMPAAQLAQRGVDLHWVQRGGDVTYHGPGQLVGYLIADLAARRRTDVARYLRGMEQALVETLSDLEVPAHTRPGYTGVFATADPEASEEGPPRKIASIGVGIRRWVTCHGFALNVSMDLSGFDVIVPCGLRHVEMTSVARELERRARPEEAARLEARARAAVAAAFREWLA